MKSYQEITYSSDYTTIYHGDFFNYYQIHVLSFDQIFSTYIDPATQSLATIKQTIQHILSQIAKHHNVQPGLFEHNGKFLITHNADIFDPESLCQFNIEFTRYEEFYHDYYDDLFDFLADQKIGVFLKNALTTVGAEDLYKEMEPQVEKLTALQLKNDNFYDNIRSLDLTDPKYILEIYKIEKNYVPEKREEILSNNFELTPYLPEYKHITKSESRFTYKVIEIATKKVIENNIYHTIESIKYHKRLRKNPPMMDIGDMQRMELDDDDPNFLSFDDYVANDDEYEEGDDE